MTAQLQGRVNDNAVNTYLCNIELFIVVVDMIIVQDVSFARKEKKNIPKITSQTKIGLPLK